MEQNTQKPKNIFISLLVVALFIVGLVLYTTHYKNNVLVKNDQIVEPAQTAVTNCGLTITGPLDDEIVTPDFIVKAVLDSSERDMLGCGWVAFEAQAGVVYVKDGMGNDVATPTPLTTVGEWMTDAPVNYTANISILNGYTGDALVIINEEDPSGEGIPKTITIPIIVK